MKLSPYLQIQLQENGLRPGDCMVLAPLYGAERKKIMNRTYYEFWVGARSSSGSNFPFWVIPLLSQDNSGECKFSLTLTPEGSEVGRYLLESIDDGEPFLLNGSLVAKSFLERGDTLNLKGNILKFQGLSNMSTLKGEEDILIESPLWDLPTCQSDLSILIEGETGTGKSYWARQIHERGGQKGVFVHLNLAAFSPGLLESELFGHVRGAFTGAVGEKLGAFREAHGGTLFLDEIDSLPLEIQVKLLLFLDSKKIRPVGGQKEFPCSLRTIFASGQCLKKLVQEGRMRKDFYYRISSELKVYLAPLRENPETISKITEQMVGAANKKVDPNLLTFYKSRSWPGNIRELKSHLKKKLLFTKGTKLIFDSLDQELIGPPPALLPLKWGDRWSLREMKEKYVWRSYYQSGGSLQQTARMLDIGVGTVKKIVGQK